MAFNPAGSDWNYLLKFYENFIDVNDRRKQVGIYEFLKNLIQNRDVSNFAHCTSHHILWVMPRHAKKPLSTAVLTIESINEERVKFELVTPIEDRESISRENIERVNCTLPYALDWFDKLTEKLNAI